METQQKSAEIKASLTLESGLVMATLSGPIFAAAIKQDLTATIYEPGMDALNGYGLNPTQRE